MKDKIKGIDINLIQRRDFLILTGIMLTVTLLYFLFLAGHILSFQSEQFLFVFSGEYLGDLAIKPGGILEYAGKFISQFYIVPFLGALILAAVLITPCFIAFRILKNLNPVSILAAPLSIIPSLLLLLMQTQYYHMMEYNLGYILVLLLIWFTIKYKNNYLPVAIFPLFFYIAGAFALIYFGFFLIYSVIHLRKLPGLIKAAIMTAVAVLTYFFFRDLLFLVPDKSLLSYPLPLINSPSHKIFFIILTAYLILIPFLAKAGSDLKPYYKLVRYTGIISGSFAVCLAIFLMIRMYNPMISNVLSIEEAAYRGKWDNVISIHEDDPSSNLVGEYFYNVALSEQGLLCERLFAVRQVFGTKAMILPWGNEHLERGAYFFYTAGLVNEAHRWAYEEMVVYGIRPHNITMLIKTSLIAGNFPIAEKYIRILEKTALFRDEAAEYRKLLNDKEGILSHPVLGQVARIIPQTDFFIYTDKPEDNLPLLFDSNPHNKRAFEYIMGWLLLEKDVETVLSNIHLMKDIGYTSLPRHIEEAVMIYYNSQGTFPDLSGFVISSETMNRFNQYFSTFVQARNNPNTLDQVMSSRFGDTFWYYYHFHK